MVGNGLWFLPSLTGFFNLKAYMCHYWKEHNTSGTDDRTINLQSVLITRALSLKNRSFRLHEHDKMHSSRIVTTHFNQARKNYQMNKFTTKQTLNKNKTRQKSKANKIRHSNSAMWQYLMQNLRKSADLFWAYRAWNYYFFFFLIATWLLNFSKWQPIGKNSVAISKDKQNLFLCCLRSRETLQNQVKKKIFNMLQSER